MKLDHQCRWVNRRLPLLAGGELGGLERRKVERHMVGCADCRGRRDASLGALAALRSLREQPPSSVDAPSLWPSLARQIRQSRHAQPALPWWDDLLPRPWGFVGVATALAVVLAAAIALPARQPEVPPAPAPLATLGEARVPAIVPSVPMAKPEVAPASSPRRTASRPALPVGAGDTLTQAPIKPIEPPSSILRFDYDLDHGTPTTPGSLDPQRTF